METKIIIRGVDDVANLRAFAEDKLTKGLNRFQKNVLTATLRLEDETGSAKGGVDKLCSIDVKLRQGEVRIKERGADFKATVNTALDRLRAALGRTVSKSKRGVAEG